MKLSQDCAVEMGQVIELEYDLKAERAMRHEVYGHPPTCYRDTALVRPIDSTFLTGNGCYVTISSDLANHAH